MFFLWIRLYCARFQQLGFVKPTAIQNEVLPIALLGKDIMAGAPTGTGKTAAYLLPAFQHLIDFPRKRRGSARVVILVPTRELALQVAEHAEKIGQFGHYKIASVIGGVKHAEQEEALLEGCDILIATPGRLMEYLCHKALDCSQIDMLILDEADRMLDMGFSNAMWSIAEQAVNRRQTLLMSATLEGEGVLEFAGQLLNEPESIDVDSPRRERKKIHQWIHLADSVAHKRALLTHLLNQDDVEKAIVFVKTRELLESLSAYLDSQGVVHATLRGEIAQSKRLDALERFRSDAVQVLVATDVAARGIDLPQISHVINYDMPRSADVYVHRIGRTARAGASGTAINLVEAHDVAVLAKVERYTQQRLKRRVIEGLEPQHKEAKIPAKRNKKKAAKKNANKSQKEKVVV